MTGHLCRPAVRIFISTLLCLLPAIAAAQAPIVTEDLFLEPTPPLGDNAAFGGAVALEGDVAVVNGSSNLPLVVRIYRRNTSGEWELEQALPKPVPSVNFGESVGVSGDIAALGDSAYIADPLSNGNGAVFIYRYNGATWAQEALLAPIVAFGAHFGRALALRGDLLVAGAEDLTLPNTGTGTVHVYRNVGTAWNIEAVLASDPAFPGLLYGSSVDTDGNVVVAGDSQQDDFGNQSGAVYVYRVVGGTWTQEVRLTPSDMLPGLAFGHSVAIHGSVLAIGAPGFDGLSGAVYVFRHNGSQWVEEQRLEGDVPSTQYALSIVAGEDIIIVSKGRHSFGGVVTGAAYVYRYQAGQWVHTDILAASDPTPLAFFSDALALDGSRALVGALRHASSPGVESGKAYLFELLPAEFRRGDVNDDGAIDIADAVAALAALFIIGTPAVPCLAAADVNSDGAHNVADAVYTLSVLFVPGWPPPAAPYPDCGPDPGGLPCASSTSCP